MRPRRSIQEVMYEKALLAAAREAVINENRISNLEKRLPMAQFDIKLWSDTTEVVVGDGRFIFAIPDDLNGYVLCDADAYVTTVSSSGTPTIQIRNITAAVDMLLVRITIDANEFTSYTAATQPIISTVNNEVETGDRIAVDVDVAGTGTKGMGVILTFSPFGFTT